jgi:radical SAM superfamily enzyme YgiQ (UPF0313 family)
MAVFLINPPLYWGPPRKRLPYFEVTRRQLDKASDRNQYPGEHLGLASIQAYAEKRGMRVHLVNALLEEHTSTDQTFAEVERIAGAHGAPTLIGMSGSSLVYGTMSALAQAFKRRWPDVKIVLGYDFATLNYEDMFAHNPDVDAVCRGDGEDVFTALAERCENGRDFGGVPGVAYRGVPAEGSPRAMVVDELPWASREQLPSTRARGWAAAVFASRGCPYRCSYCTLGETSALFGKDAYRLKSVENVVEEMAMLRRDHEVEHVTIVDDLFLTRAPSSHERAAKFAELLLERQLDMTWMIDVRVDSIEPKLFALLHKAGLRKIFVGVETPNMEQLERYNKRYLIRQETPAQRIKAAMDTGIEVVPGILTFHPDVTAKELRQTLAFIDELGWKGHYELLNRVRAYPGTPLYKEYEAAGMLTRGDWPNRGWEFKDPNAEKMALNVGLASMRPGARYEDVRATFVQELDRWESGEQPQAVSLDEEQRGAVDAAQENAGSV